MKQERALAVSQALGLPAEAVSGCMKVTVLERQEVTVEHHRGLLGYSSGVVEVGGATQRLRILGSALTLSSMDTDRLVIRGKIAAVEYE